MLKELQQKYGFHDTILQDGLQYFQCNPLFKDHLSCETTFSWQEGWSLMTGYCTLYSTLYSKPTLFLFVGLHCTLENFKVRRSEKKTLRIKIKPENSAKLSNFSKCNFCRPYVDQIGREFLSKTSIIIL